MISKNLVPSGGWFYLQGKNKIEGQTWNDLVASVAEHRINNGINVGDLEKDIESQIENRDPELKIDSKSINIMPPLPSLVDKMKSFAASLYLFITGGGKLVDQHIANQRAEICINCHNNKSEIGSEGGCCGAKPKNIFEDIAMKSVRIGIIQNRSTPSDLYLKACNICGCDLRSKVWFPRNALGVNKDNQNAYPSFCWIKE